MLPPFGCPAGRLALAASTARGHMTVRGVCKVTVPRFLGWLAVSDSGWLLCEGPTVPGLLCSLALHHANNHPTQRPSGATMATRQPAVQSWQNQPACCPCRMPFAVVCSTCGSLSRARGRHYIASGLGRKQLQAILQHAPHGGVSVTRPKALSTGWGCGRRSLFPCQ